MERRVEPDVHECKFPRGGGDVVQRDLIFRLSIDPQWELALQALLPHLEEGLASGLIQESDVDDLIVKGAILPHVRVEVDE